LLAELNQKKKKKKNAQAYAGTILPGLISRLLLEKR
jgi:hypothetical protein